MTKIHYTGMQDEKAEQENGKHVEQQQQIERRGSQESSTMSRRGSKQREQERRGSKDSVAHCETRHQRRSILPRETSGKVHSPNGDPTMNTFRMIVDSEANPCEEENPWDDLESCTQRGKKTSLRRVLAKTELRRRTEATCMLNPMGTTRLSWDLLLFVLVLYIAFAYPFFLGFGIEPRGGLALFERSIDLVFGFDILLNFNTGVVAHDHVIMNRWIVTRSYLRSWFLLDFISSFPLQILLGPAFADLQAAKLLKIGKLLKGLKMLRISKLIKIFFNSGLSEVIEEFMISISAKVLVESLRILGSCLILCHLMACFMSLTGDGYLEDYMVEYKHNCESECRVIIPDHGFGVDTYGSPCSLADCRTSAADWTVGRRYLASLYASISILTTVGFGDLVPKTDLERIYTMIAAGLGSVFFSYVIGIVAGLVAVTDANSRAYNEKIATVNAWLNFNHFPRALRRRVRSYFKTFLHERSALDEQAILNDLNPALRQEVGRYLTPDAIRNSPLFGKLSPTILGKLNPILRPVAAMADEVLHSKGTTGTNMHVIVAGAVELNYADPSSITIKTENNNEQPPKDTSPSDTTICLDASTPIKEEVTSRTASNDKEENPVIMLGNNDVCGELVALSVVARYESTATATVPTALYELDQVDLFEALSSMPEVIEKLRAVAIRRRQELLDQLFEVSGKNHNEDIELQHNQWDMDTLQNRPGAVQSGSNAGLSSAAADNLPNDFADTVLTRLSDLCTILNDLNFRMSKLEASQRATGSRGSRSLLWRPKECANQLGDRASNDEVHYARKDSISSEQTTRSQSNVSNDGEASRTSSRTFGPAISLHDFSIHEEENSSSRAHSRKSRATFG